MAHLNSEASDEMVATLCLPPGGLLGAELSIQPRPHPVTVAVASHCPPLQLSVLIQTETVRACPGAFSNSQIQSPPIATADFNPVRIKQMAFALIDRGGTEAPRLRPRAHCPGAWRVSPSLGACGCCEQDPPPRRVQ